MSKKIGFVGLGIMGSGMAMNLSKAGFEVVVYNRSAGKCTPLVDAGCTKADSLQELANSCQVVMMCLTNDAAVEQVVTTLLETASSSISLMIDHSTVSPSLVTRLSAEAREKNIGFIDAPVSGGDVGARNGTLSIMVGGEEPDFSDSLPLFNAIGKAVTYCGTSGSGQLTKCVNQLVVGLNVAAMTEGLVFANAAGLNLETTLQVISKGAAGSWSLDNYAPRLLAGDRAPGFRAEHMLKDLRLALAEADRCEVPLPASTLVKELYVSLCNDTENPVGNHGLIALYERLVGGKLV